MGAITIHVRRFELKQYEHVLIIEYRRRESFYSWRVLASAYATAQEFGKPDYRHLLDIKQSSRPALEYFNGIRSAENKWLTCLRASPKQLSTTDLIALHTISNLAVLDLSDGQVTVDIEISRFDERVMRTWAELARSRQAFQHLRVLLLGWQEHLADWIFKYADSFPSLCHIIATDCLRIHQRNRHVWESISQAAGWEARHAKRSAKSLRPIIGNEDFYVGSVSGCYYDSMELFSKLAHRQRPTLAQRLPILEVWLGTPRQWSHIVDDFPSHRTVFFENAKVGDQKALGKDLAITNREQSKRVRDRQQPGSATASPPAKRGPQSRPNMKTKGKNLSDLLEDFRT